MNIEDMKFVRVSPKEHIPFKCVCCGECCRHVRLSVPLESLDVYRMAKHLRDAGQDVASMDDFLERYAEPALLDECGYFVYFLKTEGDDDACIFLKDSRCTVHEQIRERAEPTRSHQTRKVGSICSHGRRNTISVDRKCK